MQPQQRRQQRLATLNELLLPLLRGARRYYAAWRIVNPLLAGVSRLDQTSDYTITVLTLHLPASNPLVLALYTSTQESRPVSPSQLLRRIRRLRQHVAKLRGKVFTSGDIVYILYAPRGYTRGAKRLARIEAVNIVNRVEDALKTLARYIGRRLSRLTQKLIGKRIWGELPLLVYALQELASTIGQAITIISRDQAIRLAEQGGLLRIST